VGAMADIGYRRLSDQTVGNILQRHGIPPAPERKRTTTWADFISAHMAIHRELKSEPPGSRRSALVDEAFALKKTAIPLH
jgi:hypothetical protein